MFSKKDIIFDDSKSHTEDSICEYIKKCIPDISYDDMCMIQKIYTTNENTTLIGLNFIPIKSLDYIIYSYKERVRWNKYGQNKDKRYYRIRMYNEGIKYSYMCPDQVEEMWHGRYEEVK